MRGKTEDIRDVTEVINDNPNLPNDNYRPLWNATFQIADSAAGVTILTFHSTIPLVAG